jgi:hypothetical protein
VNNSKNLVVNEEKRGKEGVSKDEVSEGRKRRGRKKAR